MKYFILLSLVATFFLGACQSKSPEEFTFITTQELAQGIKEKSFYVFDNNNPEVYQTGHIPTAVFMDYLAPNASLLPPDKNSFLVFYCKNPRCSASHGGARFARSQGYRNVRVYPEGIEGWKQAGMETEAAH